MEPNLGGIENIYWETQTTTYMTGLSGLSLKYLSQRPVKSGPIVFNSSSVGRILNPASIAFEERRAFSGLVSHSVNN